MQSTRTMAQHWISLGDKRITGYSDYIYTQCKLDWNQKVVTVAISAGVELEAAQVHIPGFSALEKAVEDHARAVTSCPDLQVVRSHFLDQVGEARFSKKAPAQAGFAWHTDKDEEVDKTQADETTDYRNTSVLFTALYGWAAAPHGVPFRCSAFPQRTWTQRPRHGSFAAASCTPPRSGVGGRWPSS